MMTRVVLSGMVIFFLVVGEARQEPSTLRLGQLKPKCDGEVHSTYLLGPDDQREISECELTELAAGNRATRIDGDGDIDVPLVGRVHLSGMTVQQVEQELNKIPSAFVLHPHVAVGVAGVRSEPVSIHSTAKEDV